MKNVVHFEYKQNLKHDVTELLITVQYSLMPSNLKPPLAKERKKVCRDYLMKFRGVFPHLGIAFFNVSVETACLS